MREVIRVVGASRTDAGVHATGQVFHFDALQRIDEFGRFENMINRMLPPDVKIYGLEQMAEINEDTKYEDIFHSRRSSLGKWYSYRFCTNSFLHPIKSRYCALLPPMKAFNIDAFNSTLHQFVGTHNFSAFANKIKVRDNEEAPDPIRSLHSIKLTQDEAPGYFRVDFLVKSALYRMLRNVVGAAVEVGLGRSSRESVAAALSSGQREDTHQGPRPAPACGLCLETVFYNDGIAHTHIDTSTTE
jgi:tRNA pseudouridine38-40 synthase